MKISDKTILIIALVTLNLIFISHASEPSRALAISPVFNRQQIADTSNDWVAVNYTGTGIYSDTAADCVSLQDQVAFPGIGAVSYLSDGKNLSATLWLSSPFKEPTKNHSLRYGMLIDVASTYEQGPDYLIDIQWNESSSSWVRTEYELLSIVGERKVLNRNESDTDFFEKGKQYVNLFSDLTQLNFPDQYQVQYFSQDNYTRGDRFCVFADSTNWVTNPPPKFGMTTVPTSVKLDTGEKKEIQLQINSTSLISPEVSLRAEERGGIKLQFNPIDPYLPPNSLGLSRLLIEARDDASPGKYTIPIVSDFSFPISDATAKNANSTFPVTNTTVASSNITRISHIVVTVEKPDIYTQISRWFDSFWKTYGDAISIVAGGFAGGFAGWVFTNKKLRRTRRSKNIDPNVEQQYEKDTRKK